MFIQNNKKKEWIEKWDDSDHFFLKMFILFLLKCYEYIIEEGSFEFDEMY